MGNIPQNKIKKNTRRTQLTGSGASWLTIATKAMEKKKKANSLPFAKGIKALSASMDNICQAPLRWCRREWAYRSSHIAIIWMWAFPIAIITLPRPKETYCLTWRKRRPLCITSCLWGPRKTVHTRCNDIVAHAYAWEPPCHLLCGSWNFLGFRDTRWA